MGNHWARNLPLFIFLCNLVSSCQASESPHPTTFNDLPAYALYRTYTFLDPHNKLNFSLCSKSIYLSVKANLFHLLPLSVIQLIARKLTWHDLRNIWTSCKFMYKYALDPGKGALIKAQDIFPYCDSNFEPTDKLTSVILKTTIAINRRNKTIPIQLNLANQLVRPGIQSPFITRLIDHLHAFKLGYSITELDLSGNFASNNERSLSDKKKIKEENIIALKTIDQLCFRLPNLIILTLKFNELTSLPQALTELSRLKTLNVAWNCLQPQSIVVCGYINQLTELDLRKNWLHSIPTELLTMPTLRSLNVCDNPLSTQTLEFLQHRDKSSTLAITFNEKP